VGGRRLAGKRNVMADALGPAVSKRDPIGLTLGGRPFYVVGVVKGLKKEGERVVRLMTEIAPDAIALAVAPEEVGGLREYDGQEVEMSKIEEAYAKHLSRWGKVELPPPPYLDALRAASVKLAPVYGLDFDEETYSSLYVELVTGLRMIAAGILEDGLLEQEFKAADEFGFAVEWDRTVNRTKGHRQLEAEREKHIAGEIARFAGKHERLLAIVEFERLDGINRHLSAAGAKPLEEF
ncbi:MAG TPA: hypothetical protein VI893_04685, partial [Thermoplasmata archaeon]|nr:hypothetical protein [Thermoplasmata archaeon]